MRPQMVFVQVGISDDVERCGDFNDACYCCFSCFPGTSAASTPQHMLQQEDSTLSLDSLLWEGGIGTKTRPFSSSSSSTLFLPLAECSAAESRVVMVIRRGKEQGKL